MGLSLLAVALFSTSSHAQCVQPPAGLIGWWPGDDDATDIAGGHDGTLQGTASFDVGQVDSAFDFDGSGFVDILDGPAWSFGSTDFTIDVWASFDSNGIRRPLVGHSDGSGSQDKWIFWYDPLGHRAPAGPALRFHINGPTLGPIDTVVYPWTPTLGQWYHLAVARAGDTYTLYVDGVPVIQETDSNEIQDAGVPLQIGAAEGFRFSGRIDEVEIFNRALGDSEIAAIYNAGSDGKCKTINSCSNEGEPCDDGNACTEGDVCQSGVCEGSSIDCAGVPECRDPGLCNPLTGTCPNPAPVGTPCDDGDVCTDGNTCDGLGNCGAPLDCDDASSCTVDSCDSGIGCVHLGAASTTCVDGFEKGLLLVNEKAAGKEKVIAKFVKGPALAQSDFGDPLVGGGTAYELCVFDGGGTLVGQFAVDRAGEDTCAGKPCWKTLGKAPPDGKGYKFKDKELASDGTALLLLKGGDEGKSKALWKSQNKTGAMPTGIAAALALGVGEGEMATVQLHQLPPQPACLSLTLPDTKKNDGQLFKAKK